MFFKLATQADPKFTVQQRLADNLWLNLDSGWRVFNQGTTKIVAKGYANDRSLQDAVTSTEPTALRGNFCAFLINADKVTITHDTDRSFPIWLGDDTVTNLEPLGESVWADCMLTVARNFVVSKHYRNTFVSQTSELSDSVIVDKVHDILLETFDNFLTNNNLPLKMFVTGGMDTTMAWAYLDHFTKNYEMVDYEYLKFTPFWRRNFSKLKQFWGYKQTHLWSEDCVLVSGAMGDENFMRGPYTMEMMLKAHGTSLFDILKPEDYHWKHCQGYFKKGLDVGSIDPDINKVIEQVMNRNSNDHQHWHIEETIHFTPFKDSRILSLITMSSKDQLVLQARDAHINRLLIEKLDPDKLKKISAYKNHDSMENL